MAVQILPALLMAAAGYGLQQNAIRKANKKQMNLIKLGQDRADKRFEKAQDSLNENMEQYDPRTRNENYQAEKDAKRLQLLEQINAGGSDDYSVGTDAAGQEGGFFQKEKARRMKSQANRTDRLATLNANARGFGGLNQKEAINNARYAALESIMRGSARRMANLGNEQASYIRPNGTQMMLGQGLMTVGSMYATGGAA